MRCAWEELSIPNAELYEELRAVDYAGNGHAQQLLHVAVPRNKTPSRAVIFFHGGGLTGGGMECPRALFDGRNAVVIPRYRWIPDVSPQDCLEDAADATAWTMRAFPSVWLGGMSAGAYLAAMVGMDQDFLARRALNCRDLAGLLLISGQMSTHFQLKLTLKYPGANAVPVIDRYAPLFHLSKELPPVLCVTGASGLDVAGRPEENALFHATLKALGHTRSEHHALSGHDHGGAFESCGHLVARFLERYSP